MQLCLLQGDVVVEIGGQTGRGYVSIAETIGMHGPEIMVGVRARGSPSGCGWLVGWLVGWLAVLWP